MEEENDGEKLMEHEKSNSQPQTEEEPYRVNYNTVLDMIMIDENTAATVQNLVADFSAKLDGLRRITEQKEAAARQTEADVLVVENQLRTHSRTPNAGISELSARAACCCV
ncbi:hypothetical protein Q1695_007164 [Nippostrongylus brasiliensis]|nr:hypothetical protein Q1695_007164 [Nippostrongylus brasiliensis]